MFERFRRGAEVSQENWRDHSHDLEAIRLASDEDFRRIESFLLNRGPRTPSDVEAFATLATPAATHALREALEHAAPEIQAAILHFASELLTADERTRRLVACIADCEPYHGLDLTLQQIETHHPPAVIDAMLARVANDPGPVAVHFAGMLLYLHGASAEPFDWELRPFLLRFHAGDESDRHEALAELLRRIGRAANENTDGESNHPSRSEPHE
ncbi:MAG: hypothetical protein R3B96_02640 [Pirellulaceae bacterium]